MSWICVSGFCEPVYPMMSIYVNIAGRKQKSNSKVKARGKEKNKQGIKPDTTIPAFVTCPTKVSTESLNKYLQKGNHSGWWSLWRIAAQPPLICFRWPTMSLLIIFSIHHPFTSQSQDSLLGFSYFGTNLCVCACACVNTHACVCVFSWGHWKKSPCFILLAGLLSLLESFWV